MLTEQFCIIKVDVGSSRQLRGWRSKVVGACVRKGRDNFTLNGSTKSYVGEWLDLDSVAYWSVLRPNISNPSIGPNSYSCSWALILVNRPFRPRSVFFCFNISLTIVYFSLFRSPPILKGLSHSRGEVPTHFWYIFSNYFFFVMLHSLRQNQKQAFYFILTDSICSAFLRGVLRYFCMDKDFAGMSCKDNSEIGIFRTKVSTLVCFELSSKFQYYTPWEIWKERTSNAILHKSC